MKEVIEFKELPLWKVTTNNNNEMYIAAKLEQVEMIYQSDYWKRYGDSYDPPSIKSVENITTRVLTNK